MGVNMNGALPVHEGSECKYEESYVGALSSFVDVESSYVGVGVDVVRNEESSLKSMKDVTRWCRSRLSL